MTKRLIFNLGTNVFRISFYFWPVLSVFFVGCFEVKGQTFDFENNSLSQWSQSAANHWEITNSGVIGGSYSQVERRL